MRERQVRESLPLGLDLVDRAAAHGERLAGVLLREPVDHLERRVALARRDDPAADPRREVGLLEVDDGDRDPRIAREVPRLAARLLREEDDPAVLDTRPDR